MPKAKKSSNKDTSDFIKKVASAGRGGDTELAHLSPKARELLKKLGGAGTKNPKTKLKEYRVARESGVSPFAEELLEESNPAEQEAARAAQEQAVAERPEVMVRPQKQDSVEAFIREQEERDRVPRTEDDEPITAPGSAADNLAQLTGTSPTTTLTPEQLAELTRINAAGFGRLTTGYGGPGPRPEEGDLARLRDAQLLREAQEEEARRRAVEEEARRRAAAEEAARLAAEEAARKEAARLVAEEEARRTAEEQARRIAEQDIQARRAADEARRVAEEARLRAEAERNRPPVPPPVPPPAPPPVPPGLINSPLPPNPPISPPTTGGGTVPGGGGVQTADFINRPARSPSGINYGFFGDDTDIGRLVNSLDGGRGRVPGGRPLQGVPGGPSDVKIPELPPISGGFPTPTTRPLPDTGAPPPAYPSGGGGSYPSTPSVPPGYQAAPLPVMPGAGTGTPFFNPASGGLMPGTIPASQMPQSLQTSNIPLQAIEANPNLSPTILGGTQNLGYYTDRFGNVILSPGAVKPTGRKKGGPSNQEELMELLRERNEADGYGDLDSARSMLEGLSRAPASSKTEVSLSPNAQSVRRTSRTPIRQDSERGSARGMAMELEEITQSKDQAPRTKRQTREAQQKMELIRETLGMPTFSQASLSRAGDLMAKNFNEGGEAKSSAREELDEHMVPLHIQTYLESMMGDPSKRTAPITEANFSGAELAKLRRLIELAKTRPVSDKKTGKVLPNTVTYAHHDAYKERYEHLGGLPGPDTDRSPFPTANLRNTLGTFSFKEMPDGTYVVKDTYDFTGDVNEKDNFFIRRAKQAGVSRPVQIVVPALKERKDALPELKVQPKRRANGSPRTGETSADLYRSLLESSDLSRSIPTSPPSGSSKDSKKSQEDLRKLILAMNPDAQGIEEAVAGAPKTLDATKRAGKGFYEANVAPLLSPIETAKGLVNLAGEFATNPYRTTIDVAGAEGDRLNKTRDSSGNFAEYLGGAVNPFSRVLRAPPVSQVVRPKGQGIVLDYPDAPAVPTGNPMLRAPRGYVSGQIDKGQLYLSDTYSPFHTLSLPADKYAAIADFLKTKVRSYFVNQFGTKDDPIFRAIKEGKLSTTKLREPGGVREYLPGDAREGTARVNPETGKETFYPNSRARAALEDINRIYDDMTGLRGTVLAERTIGDPKYANLISDKEELKASRFQEETGNLLLEEGVAPYEINPNTDLLGYRDPSLLSSKALPIDKLVSNRAPSPEMEALLLLGSENLPKSLKTAIEKGQPIYDMAPSGPLAQILNVEKLVDHLATLSAREIKNLRFEDAIKGSVKTIEEKAVRLELGRRIRAGKPVDKAVFLKGVSDPLLKYDANSAFPGFTWRRINDPDATIVEGAYIGHSVGGYAKGGDGINDYGPEKHQDFLDGKVKVYTLRDAKGRPVTTVEVDEVEGFGPVVKQVKGAGRKSGNSADKTPYDTALVDLFNDLKVKEILEYDIQLPPLSLAYKQQVVPMPKVLKEPYGGGPARIDAPQVQQGIGQLPNAPQNLPNEGRIRATLRRLGID